MDDSSVTSGLVIAQDARPDLSILGSRTRPGNVSLMHCDTGIAGLGAYLEPLTPQLRRMSCAFCDLRFSQVPRTAPKSSVML